MKVWFRCYKCGESFEAEEGVRTDVCPRCMSFVDLKRAEKITAADDKNAAKEENIFAANSARATSTSPEFSAKTAAMPSAKERANGAPPAKVAGTPARDISPQGCPAGADAEDTYDSLYAKAEKMLTFGAWGNASELFRHCLEKRESWQAHFGLVRATTRELTDLSNFSAVQKDADAAFDKMTAAERISLGKRYVPKLDEKRQSLKNSLSLLERNDLHEFIMQKDKRSTLGEPNRKGIASIAVGGILLAVFLIIGAALFGALPEQPAVGTVVLCVGIAAGVVCIAFGARAYSKEKRANAAKEAVRAVTEQTRNIEREKLMAQIDAIDYLCGFLKY